MPRGCLSQLLPFAGTSGLQHLPALRCIYCATRRCAVSQMSRVQSVTLHLHSLNHAHNDAREIRSHPHDVVRRLVSVLRKRARTCALTVLLFVVHHQGEQEENTIERTCTGAQLDICVDSAFRCACEPRRAASIWAKALLMAPRHAGEPPTMGSLRDAAITSLYPVFKSQHGPNI
jgi:hypothetical protein